MKSQITTAIKIYILDRKANDRFRVQINFGFGYKEFDDQVSWATKEQANAHIAFFKKSDISDVAMAWIAFYKSRDAVKEAGI